MRITRQAVMRPGGMASATPVIMTVWLPLVYFMLDTASFQLRMWRRTDQFLDRTFLENEQQFDFIIVGAGLAGGVAANRLTRAGHSVLLLEAGGDPYPLQIVPGFLMAMLNHPETDWMYRTTPQKKASLNSVNAESSWSAGKGLGGTGTINIMIFLRGHHKDFDNWARITNDSSWSFDGLLPHFKDIEDYTKKLGPVDERYHGVGGELVVDEPDFLGMADQWVAAAGEFGYPKVDLNAPFSEGFDRIKYPIKDGRRIASYLSFIVPIKEVENLVVLKYAHVNKILIDENNRAYGVEYEKFGKVQTALAKKEVILSAGTVNSAQILMLSGIGPKRHLESKGITVKRDLPVGQNLQDHIGVFLHPFFINQPTLTRSSKPLTVRLDRDITLKAFLDWLNEGRGVLTSSGVQATGCISSTFAKARDEGDWPDIHYFLFGFSASSKLSVTVSKAFNLEPEDIEKYYKHADGKDSFYIIVTGARPFSRGFIELKSADPTEHPVIDPKYLDDAQDTDIKVLLEAVKRVVTMMENSTAIGKNLGGHFTTEKLPGCEHLEMRSDEYWICYIRRYSVTLHHPVGTAKMGHKNDETAVVDTRLRVRGVKNLRVVDSSIQPVIIVTNTGASAMAIGAKGASMILEDWGSPSQVPKNFHKNTNKYEQQSAKSQHNEFPLDNRIRRITG